MSPAGHITSATVLQNPLSGIRRYCTRPALILQSRVFREKTPEGFLSENMPATNPAP